MWNYIDMYLNPVSPYVPKSISLRWQPIQTPRVLLTDQTVNETPVSGCNLQPMRIQ